MRRLLLLPALLATLAYTAACAGSDAAASPDSASSSSAPAAASRTAVGDADADLEEISEYRLSMRDVERWYEAQRNVYAAMQRDPSIARRMEAQGQDDDPSLDDLERAYGAVPEVREGIEAAGLEVREFAVVAYSLMQASMAAMAMEMGGSRDSVVANTGVAAANLDFVRTNRAELERLQAEMATLAPPDAGDEDEVDQDDER